MFSGALVEPDASPWGLATLRNSLPHSCSYVTHRNTALTWSAIRFWSETCLSVNEIEGTSLFCPLTMPASNHPVVTFWTRRPVVRSTGLAQPAHTTRPARSRRAHRDM